ncbi:MAG: diaminopimelate decarboxylase [Actinomycetia bacterium]|nr:diaminopimelate decarboxylase [Actinomycetes bacterium]MCP4960689.1 diaminopimelate decarboxylase [Actinomycetes bacterium]
MTASSAAAALGPVPSNLLPDNAQVGANGHLHVAGVDLVELAYDYGTPLFVYDEDHLRARCREAVDAFGEGVAYASKAFLCRAMARIAHEEGMHIDVATVGEMHVALAADVPADRLVMHGNNKDTSELAEALEAGVGRIVVDSFDELDKIEALVSAGAQPPDVLLRVTPGVKAETHDFISTGQNDSKFGFGVSSGAAATGVERAIASDAMNVVGIHSHIGSQVFRVESLAEALEVIARFSEPYGLPELSIGGGLGVAYVEGEATPSISKWGAMTREVADRLCIGASIGAEPGRAIAASAAVTLYKVGTIKELPGIRTYVAVDGGYGDNPRPVLYGSDYTTFLPRCPGADRTLVARVVGKHCESGDVLVSDAHLPPDLTVGDILATPVTGAYGHSMGSNYNKVFRPAVVFVRDGQVREVVRRETVADLLATDIG